MMEFLNIGNDYADYLSDESRRVGHAERIAFPKSTQEVCEALKTAAENHWPVTVQGGRTGVSGGCVPGGGLILSLARMNAIGGIENDCMTAQPGALLAEVQESIAGSGYVFPTDPTETTASIGGMVAGNASGARSFHYGPIRDWIHALEVVLPNAETIHLERGQYKADGLSFRLKGIEGVLPGIGMPNVKNAAGYFVKPDMDLIDLFIGAEGTLGVVTKVSLKLVPDPETIIGLATFFASEAEALDFVRFLREVESPNPPVAIEFFDSESLNLLRRMKSETAAFLDQPKLDSEFHTAIYFEYEGDVPNVVVEKASEAVGCWIAEGEREIKTLKDFRHAVPEAVNMLIAGRKRTIPELTKLGTDMAVPDGLLENVMRMYRAGLAETGLEYVIFGHIGDNHLHVNILPRSMEEYEKGKSLYLDWAGQVVEMGGSVSAEHGIGKNKTAFLELMYGKAGVEKMRKLKSLFDPCGLLNPGNLFPSPTGI